MQTNKSESGKVKLDLSNTFEGASEQEKERERAEQASSWPKTQACISHALNFGV